MQQKDILEEQQNHILRLTACIFLLPVRYGIVITVYIAYRIIDAIRTTLQFKQTYLLMVLIIMLVYSFAENGLTLFYSSFVFICASCLKNKEGE